MTHARNPYPSLSRPIKKLWLTPDGSTLLQQSQDRLHVWAVDRAQLLCTVPGSLVGIANDGQMLLTRHVDKEYRRRDVASLAGFFRRELAQYREPPCTFRAWATGSGAERELAAISRDAFAPQQRLTIFANRWQPALMIKETIGPEPLYQEHQLHFDGLLENWLIAPDNRHLVLVYYVSAGGFDGWTGHCVELATGEVQFEFRASSTPDSLPQIYFAAEHQLLISNHGSSFDFYHLATGKHLANISRFDEAPYRVWGSCFAVNPVDRSQFVCSYHQEPYAQWSATMRQKRQNWRAEEYTNSVIIARSSRRSNEGSIVAVLKQSAPIVDVVYFPNGTQIAALLDNGEICIWDVSTTHLLARWSVNPDHPSQ